MQDARGGRSMPQPELEPDCVVMIVSCEHCRQEQLVHVQAGGGTWSMAHQSFECLGCGRHSEVMLPDAIMAGPFLTPNLSMPRSTRRIG
jgi:transposase-like protein